MDTGRFIPPLAAYSHSEREASKQSLSKEEAVFRIE
jgi:hypothetical protein